MTYNKTLNKTYNIPKKIQFTLLVVFLIPIILGIWGVYRSSSIVRYRSIQQIKTISTLNLENVVTADGFFFGLEDKTSLIHLVLEKSNLNDFVKTNNLTNQLTFDKQKINEIFEDISYLPLGKDHWIEKTFFPVFALRKENDTRMFLLVGGTNTTMVGSLDIYIKEEF
ncbi:MAG: hypothetical protein PF692_00265 [Kiritimatiellae bacterium]|jgi:hypothetical protein|nr:hypothetical protein [Kiritimatiellia bacterium]